jgi:hypothetical protein
VGEVNRWEGEWVNQSDLDGPWPVEKWQDWLRHYGPAYELFRHRKTNGGVIRCRTCDYAVILPIFPWRDTKMKARRWMAEHTLTHADTDGVILVFDEEEPTPDSR